MRLYRWLAGIILTLLLLIPAAVITLVASETGSRWLLVQGQEHLPIALQYEAFHGTLLSDFRFSQLSIETESFSYTPDELKISWRPLSLLSGIIRINHIESRGGELRLRAAQNKQKDSSNETIPEDINIELPIDLNLRRFSILNTQFFILETPPQQLTINSSLRINTNGQLNIREFELDHQYLTTLLSGKVELSYPFKSNINNDIQLHSPDFPTLRAQSHITGDIRGITTNSSFSEGLSGKIEGKLENPLNELKWQFDSQWKDNNLTPWLKSFGVNNLEVAFEGTIKGHGDINQAQISPATSVMVNQNLAEIEGALTYLDNALTLSSLKVSPKGDIEGLLTLNGGVSSLSNDPVIDISINWDEVIYQPNSLISHNGQLKAQGKVDNLFISLDNTLLGLLEQEVRLTAEARVNPESLNVQKWQVTQNNETLSGDALLSWKKDLSLATHFSGHFQQQPVDARIKARLPEPYLFIDELEAHWGELSLQAEGSLSPGRQLNWELIAEDLTDLSDVQGRLAAKGQISGQLNHSQFDFNLNAFNLKLPDYNTLSLKQPMTGSFDYADTSFEITPLCLLYESLNSPLCIEIEQHKDSINFAANTSHVPLAFIQALAFPDTPYSVNGELALDVSGSLDSNKMTLETFNGVINADNAQVRAADETVTLNQLSVKAKNGSNNDINVTLTAAADELDFDLSGQLNIEKFSPDSPISGTLLLSSKSLELLNTFTPQVNIGDGNTSAELDIAGNLDDPTVSGNLVFESDRLVILESGTLMTHLQAELIADAKMGEFTVNANAKVGEGDVNVNGRLNIFQRSGLLTIKGDDLLVLDTPDLLLSASPDIRIELDKKLVNVTGALNVPKARITPVELSQATTESADVTLKNEIKEEPLFFTKADITLSLGKDVRVEALGFSGNLQGQLQITQQPGSAARGNGSIGVVSGNYEIYGQKLAIERGDLLFNGGPLDTPSLNLRVTRKITGNGATQRPPETIGARVTGTIDQPELSLFSTPSLPDSTILSYLLFGKPPGTQGDVNNLELQAALLVGGRSTEFLTEGIKSTFDLDEVSLDSETSDVNDTSLYIGKYLSPQLYIKYGIGLLEPTSTFILRYTLSEKLLFESTSTTEGQGGDLIYTIEN